MSNIFVIYLILLSAAGGFLCGYFYGWFDCSKNALKKWRNSERKEG